MTNARTNNPKYRRNRRIAAHTDRRSPERSALRLYALIPSTALILIFVFHLRPDPASLAHPPPPFLPSSAPRAPALLRIPQPFLTPSTASSPRAPTLSTRTGTTCPAIPGRHTYFPPELRAFKSFIFTVTAISLFFHLAKNITKVLAPLFYCVKYIKQTESRELSDARL